MNNTRIGYAYVLSNVFSSSFFFEMYISTYDCVLKHGKCGHFFMLPYLKRIELVYTYCINNIFLLLLFLLKEQEHLIEYYQLILGENQIHKAVKGFYLICMKSFLPPFMFSRCPVFLLAIPALLTYRFTFSCEK